VAKPVVYLITFIVCIFLQMGVAPAIAIAGIQPDFLVIPVLLVALYSGVGLGSLTGFLLGLFFDLSVSGTVGCMALVFTIVACIVAAIGQGMETRAPLLACLIALCSSFAIEILYGIAVALTNPDAGGVGVALLTSSLPTALYTTVFACIALVTIGLVMAGDAPAAHGRLGGSSRNSIPRMQSRLK
jgi:rod shape-determining protein MreD